MNKSRFKYEVTTNVATIQSVESTKTEALKAAAEMLNDENVGRITILKVDA